MIINGGFIACSGFFRSWLPGAEGLWWLLLTSALYAVRIQAQRSEPSLSSSVLRHDLFHPSAIANFNLHSSPSSSSLHYCLCAIARSDQEAPPPLPQAFSQKLCRPSSTRESSVAQQQLLRL